MKQILIYFNSMKPAGGIERVISNLANKWASNYQVTILTKDAQTSFYSLDKRIETRSLNLNFNLDMGNRVHRIIQTGISYTSSVRKLRAFLKQYSFDYIYVATPLNALEIYMTHTIDITKKLVISEHASYYGYNKMFNRIKKIIYPKAYQIVVPTTMDTVIYESKGYHTTYIPHLTTFSAETEPSSLKTKTAVNVGRLTSDKRQRLLLTMWKDIESDVRKNNWRLIIVGKGEEKWDLQNYIDKNELGDIAEIIPPRKKIGEIYKKASLFTFTSRYEGFGMVLLEAMAFGIPCISFNIPSGPKDIITDKLNGYLIPDGNKELYENYLKEYIQFSTSEKEKMGKQAIDTVRSWNNQQILELWDEIFRKEQ